MIACEDLKSPICRNQASGSMENKGRHVKAKSGLNKSILDQGWGMMVNMLGVQAAMARWVTVKINPRYTNKPALNASILLSITDKLSQIQCVKCMYVANADFNAARNILAATGHAVLSAEGGCSKGRPLKQKVKIVIEGFELPTIVHYGSLYSP